VTYNSTDFPFTDLVLESPDEGADTVKASISYTLPANVENLVLTGSSALNGDGNELANRLTGNSEANAFHGFDGNDTLDGGWGIDTAHFAGARSDYTITRAAGQYTVTDNNAANGNDGIDTLLSIERLQFADGMTPLANGPMQHAGRAAAPSLLDTQRDLNGDGKSDVLRTNPNGGTEISLMDGANTLATLTIGPYAGWTMVDARGDFNGDGKADLTWRHDNGNIALWLMDGVQPTAMEIIDPRMNWGTVDTQRDFNGDGKSDLLWKLTDGTTSIWLMDGVDATAKQSIASHAGWNLLDVRGDFNADGKADLAWQHTDGTVAVWMMDGANRIGTLNLGHHDAGWPLG
jgi:hypothetical protein